MYTLHTEHILGVRFACFLPVFCLFFFISTFCLFKTVFCEGCLPVFHSPVPGVQRVRRAAHQKCWRVSGFGGGIRQRREQHERRRSTSCSWAAKQCYKASHGFDFRNSRFLSTADLRTNASPIDELDVSLSRASNLLYLLVVSVPEAMLLGLVARAIQI